MNKPKKISLPELIAKCQIDTNCNDWAEIGTIGIELGTFINNTTGVDVKDYRIVVEGSSLIHSINRHGIGSNDRNPIDFTDFFCLPEIIKKPENIRKRDNSKLSNNKRLIFEKTIGHTFYCIEEIREGYKKGQRIAFVSLWKRIIDEKQKPLK